MSRTLSFFQMFHHAVHFKAMTAAVRLLLFLKTVAGLEFPTQIPSLLRNKNES